MASKSPSLPAASADPFSVPFSIPLASTSNWRNGESYTFTLESSGPNCGSTRFFCPHAAFKELMQRRRNAMLTSLALLCAAVWTVSSVATHAQTAQPITSLPKPPGDSSVTDTTSQNAPAQQETLTQQRVPQQNDSVHPITSLPKPPVKTLPPEPEAVPTVVIAMPVPQPVPQPAAATTESATTPAPSVATTPVLPSATTPSDSTSGVPAAAAYPRPPAKSSTPAAAEPPPTQPDMGPHALVASVQPAERPSRSVRPPSIRAFSTIAVQVKGGFAGAGLDLATPLSKPSFVPAQRAWTGFRSTIGSGSAPASRSTTATISMPPPMSPQGNLSIWAMETTMPRLPIRFTARLR